MSNYFSEEPKFKSLLNKKKELEQEIKQTEKYIEKVREEEIIDMLKEKSSPASSRSRFTYQEISNRMECSPAKVANIAKKHDLSRKPKKPSIFIFDNEKN